ncbi:hypothetical protein GOBAR_DD27842 [Gossypium barbadense]|nr:hypothetical protein GOBAR_DD27842 [Gossypium barbadense]
MVTLVLDEINIVKDHLGNWTIMNSKGQIMDDQCDIVMPPCSEQIMLNLWENGEVDRKSAKMSPFKIRKATRFKAQQERQRLERMLQAIQLSYLNPDDRISVTFSEHIFAFAPISPKEACIKKVLKRTPMED